jgi:hypothetical protein
LTSPWQLVFRVQTPRCDHRQHEESALAEQRLIDVRVTVAHLNGYMGEVKFDRAATTRLEVNKQRAVPGIEDVPRVRLAMQQLLGRS